MIYFKKNEEHMYMVTKTIQLVQNLPLTLM